MWQITTFSHKTYIFGFHFLEAILKVKSTCKILVLHVDVTLRMASNKWSYLPSTLSQHKYMKASGYTCCCQALYPNRFIVIFRKTLQWIFGK